MKEPTTIIRPRRKGFGVEDLQELWNYRELVYFFVWRDLKVRYKQTIIGIVWAIFQPVMTMIVFSVFFGTLAKMPSEGVPYPIFVYSGLLFWNFFVASLTDVSNCLISNQSIVTKVYFPRLILPISSAFTNFVDFLIASGVLIVLMIYYGFVPHLDGLFMLPLLLLITFASSTGLGLFLASVNVKYRDIRYILPFFIQLLIFVSPVIYPAGILGKFTILFGLNPIAGVISTARSVLFGITPVSWLSLGFSILVSSVLLLIGLYSFRKSEAYFADYV